MNNYSFEDLHLGMEESFSILVTEKMMDLFLELSGDSNPLHTDLLYANQKGFKNKVVYGLLTTSFYSRLAGLHIPGKHCILHGINVQFTKPVFSGDQLTIIGQISYLNEAYQQVEVKAYIINQNSEKISKATIKAGVLDA